MGELLKCGTSSRGKVKDERIRGAKRVKISGEKTKVGTMKESRT